MTQKELLYVEDAIGHERVIISSIEEVINSLDDEDLQMFMHQELSYHKKMEEDLLNVLEDLGNE